MFGQLHQRKGPSVGRLVRMEFPWLMCKEINVNDKMFCLHCEMAGRRNGFTRGSNHFRISALIEHSQSNDHVVCVCDSQEGRIIFESLLSLNIVRDMTRL